MHRHAPPHAHAFHQGDFAFCGVDHVHPESGGKSSCYDVGTLPMVTFMRLAVKEIIIILECPGIIHIAEGSPDFLVPADMLSRRPREP